MKRRRLLGALVLVAVSAGPAVAGGRHGARSAPVSRIAPIDLDAIELEPVEPAEPADLAVIELAPAEPAVVAAPPARRAPRRGRLHVRAGVLHVAPRVQSGEMVLSGVAGPASLAVENGPIAGSRAELGAVTTPAMLIGYAIPLGGGELGIETVLAPPITFELRAAGTVATESLAPTVLGTVPTGIPPLGEELGHTKALPPVVTIVYRARRDRRFRPYAGVGVSYLYSYGAVITNPTMTEVAPPRLVIDDAVSAVGQVGLDVHVAGPVYATLDVKAMTGFATSARVENLRMKTPAFPLYESVYVGDVSVDVVTRPVLVTLGAGTSF